MGINRASEAGVASSLLQYARSKKYKALSFARSFGLIALSVVVLMLIPDKGWSQQSGWTQQGGQSGAHRLYAARAKENPAPPATPTIARAKENPATLATPTIARAKENPATLATPTIARVKENPATLATPAIEPTSPLGQALASCDSDTAVQETFELPGLKGEVTLDRCYKGHGHLICVFNALIAEAKSLTDTYTPIVDAKYPEFNSVENICQIKPDNLASHTAGAEDFTKRFAMLKSKYETASKCAINVKQAFRDVVLSDMTQPPEILKSMTESIEADVTRVSDVENQTVDLAAKVEAAKKAMKTIEKIHRAMCVKDKTTVIGRAGNADPAGH